MNIDLGMLVAGAAQEGANDLRKRREVALDLKMKSALMEQQAMSQMASPEVSGALGQFAGVPNRPGQQYNPTDVNAALGIGKANVSLANAEARARGSRGYGLDRPIGLTMAKMLEKKYGMPAEQTKDMPWRAMSTLTKSGNKDAINETADAITSLGEMPAFYNELKGQAGTPGASDRATAYLKQSDSKVRDLLYPEIAQAEKSFLNIYIASIGGKNITENEMKLARNMAVSWAYGPEEMQKAETAFRAHLMNKIKGRLNGGQLGWAREGFVSELNNALMKNGLEPIELKAFDLKDGATKQKARKSLAELMKEASN